MGATDFEVLWKSNFDYYMQVVLFCGIFISISIKTPLYFVHTWLLKAHTEAPLGGSIILAGIVLKLGLYAVIRLILPILPEACVVLTPAVSVICVITIIYASLNTLRTLDLKELVAYSSVSHAAVYLLGVFSNTIAGIEGSIVLGLAHGLSSSGLFIIVGGVFYDRFGTRFIGYYRGLTQLMPLVSVLFFIFCLANCGAPLTLNFVGEFLSLYGAFERLPLMGVFAALSIVFSAAYSIFLFNRVAFGGALSVFFEYSTVDLSKREFVILGVLVLFTVLFGIFPNFILDGLHYGISGLIYDCSFKGSFL